MHAVLDLALGLGLSFSLGLAFSLSLLIDPRLGLIIKPYWAFSLTLGLALSLSLIIKPGWARLRFRAHTGIRVGLGLRISGLELGDFLNFRVIIGFGGRALPNHKLTHQRNCQGISAATDRVRVRVGVWVGR